MDDITDIRLILKSFVDRLSTLENKIDQLEKENSHLLYKLHQSENENKRLKERLSKYESPKKDSHNSSIPPSKEDICSSQHRRTQSLRKKSDKKSGGQLGHQGSSLSFNRNPDKVENHYASYCSACGNSLFDAKGILLEERWSIDLPVVIPELTVHRLIGKQCHCGCLSKGMFPSHAKSHVSYGPNLRATVGYLSTEHHLPYKRLCEVLKDLFNQPISQGTVNNILNDILSSGANIYEQIKNRISQSSVVGADETGTNISGKLNWFWAFQTDNLTYVYADQSRGKAAIEKHFPQGLPNSILVTDRHFSYFRLNVKSHQICLAHLLRELTYLQELDPNEPWSGEMKKLLQKAIHKRKTEKLQEINRKAILEEFERLLFRCMDKAHKLIQSLQKSLIKHRKNVFQFLFDPNVPYDNNASERCIRALKIKQKVSGGFRSNQGAKAYAIIHSIADTARKNKQSPFDAIQLIARKR